VLVYSSAQVGGEVQAQARCRVLTRDVSLLPPSDAMLESDTIASAGGRTRLVTRMTVAVALIAAVCLVSLRGPVGESEFEKYKGKKGIALDRSQRRFCFWCVRDEPVTDVSVTVRDIEKTAMLFGIPFTFNTTAGNCKTQSMGRAGFQGVPTPVLDHKCQLEPQGGVGFVGIEKAGSTSMQRVLVDDARTIPTLWNLYDPDDKICDMGPSMGWHHASAEFQQRIVGREAWEAAFTFAVVRNPWARQVSAYRFHTKDYTRRVLFYAIADMHLGNNFYCFGKFLSRADDVECFRTWLRRLHRLHPPGSPSSYLFLGFPYGNHALPSHNSSQLSLCADSKGHLLVDRVYALERLESHWPELQARLPCLRNVSYKQSRHESNACGYTCSSKLYDYREYYDEETASIVAAYAQPEIRALNYSFGD
jgi:hypothetical protein